MKRTKILIILLLLTNIFIGCGSNNSTINPFVKEKKVLGFSFINGSIIEVFGDKVIVELDNKDVVIGNSYEDKLTNKIIKSSMFIVGMDTNIGNEKAKVSDIRVNQITFIVKNTKLKKDDSVKIFIPKKTIAIMNFSLIGIANNDIKQVAMEDMTTKMVQSGQYIVVERTKLDTILKEQELANSGLLEENAASKVGKLVSADIILTGSFAKRANKWNVNLRLVDVATGVIISAINDKIDSSQFRPKQSKDTSNITENFEDAKLNKGWVKNINNLEGPFKASSGSVGMIDKTIGANGTLQSFRIDYHLIKPNSRAVFLNKRLRDISKYKGIKFFAKANKNIVLLSLIMDKNFDNTGFNKWMNPINITTTWKEYKIPFNQYDISRKESPTNGDGVLDLDNVERLSFVINAYFNNSRDGQLWIDEISFY